MSKASKPARYELTDAERATADSLAKYAHLLPKDPCPYDAHRATDWRLPGGLAVCGVCHPPGKGLTVELIGAPA